MYPKTLPSIAILVLSPLLAFTGILANEPARSPAPPLNNALFVSPVNMMINSAILDFPVISIAYERLVSTRGISLFVPMHFGWLENMERKNVAGGGGLGGRKYFGDAFSGTYLTFQSEYIYHYFRGRPDLIFTRDENGNPLPESGQDPVTTEDYLSTSQLSLGYKWLWKQFTLDLSGGGAFYAQDKEKYTSFIASANVGFPFNSGSFGL